MTKLTHTLIRASAGSGKTFALTNRYLSLLAAGVDPGRILATTFTRKAAGEIFERLLSRLALAAVDPEEFEELRGHVDEVRSPADCLAALERLLAALDRLQILTIDAFFIRLAGCFTLDLALPPNWRIVDEEEDAAARADAVSEALAAGKRVELAALVHMLAGGALKREVHGAYLGAVSDAHIAYQQAGREPQPWAVYQPRTEPLENAALATALARLEEAPLQKKANGEFDSRWVAARDLNLQQARSENWEDFLGKGLAGKLPTGLFHKKPFPEALIQACTPLVEHARAALMRELANRNQATYELVHRFDSLYLAAKQRSGACTFDDVPRLLQQSDLVGDTQELYYRLDGVIDHVLLDEFQDTSLTQFALLEPMLAELLSQQDTGKSVFCVGDAKQSLYMWREAEPELLASLGKRWDFTEKFLDKSYRSAPPIMEVVNRVFASLRQSELNAHPQAVDAWDDLFKEHTTAKEQMAGSYVLRSGVVVEGADKENSQPEVLADIADRVAALHREAPAASIGVLLRTRKRVDGLAQALAEMGVEVSKEAGNPLSEAPAVAAALSLLRFLDHPGDTASAFHVAISPFGPRLGLHTPLEPKILRAVGRHLRQRLEREGCAAFFADLLRACAGELDAGGVACFKQFLTLAEEVDSQPMLRPGALIELAEHRRVETPGAEAVRVMTIHGAKGLEFDVVVLPELDSQWRVRSESVLTHRPDLDSPVVEATRYPKGVLRACDAGLQKLYESSLDREILEELCCLYVAMTRAKRHLEMIVPGGKPPGLCAAKVLLSTLAPGEDWAPDTVYAELVEGDWAGEVAAASSEGMRIGEAIDAVPLAFAAKGQADVSRWPRRSPSSLEGGERVALADLLGGGDGRAKDRGTLLHAWCELVEWVDEDSPSEMQLLAQAARCGVEELTARAEMESFRSSLQRSTIREALSRAAYADRLAANGGLRVHSERPFAVRDAGREDREPVLLTGRFDRVVVCEVEGRAVWAEIVDFKTDQVSTAEDAAKFAARVEHYRPQMQAYRRAAARVWGLEPEAITGKLLFLSAGAVVDV
jgi:ATP-dependent helicase/nuclease subunit A